MVAYCYAGISTCGPESVTGWFVVQQLLQLVVVMLVPTVIQSIVRDQIKASLESQDADSLVHPGTKLKRFAIAFVKCYLLQNWLLSVAS